MGAITMKVAPGECVCVGSGTTDVISWVCDGDRDGRITVDVPSGASTVIGRVGAGGNRSTPRAEPGSRSGAKIPFKVPVFRGSAASTVVALVEPDLLEGQSPALEPGRRLRVKNGSAIELGEVRFKDASRVRAEDIRDLDALPDYSGPVRFEGLVDFDIAIPVPRRGGGDGDDPRDAFENRLEQVQDSIDELREWLQELAGAASAAGQSEPDKPASDGGSGPAIGTSTAEQLMEMAGKMVFAGASGASGGSLPLAAELIRLLTPGIAGVIQTIIEDLRTRSASTHRFQFVPGTPSEMDFMYEPDVSNDPSDLLDFRDRMPPRAWLNGYGAPTWTEVTEQVTIPFEVSVRRQDEDVSAVEVELLGRDGIALAKNIVVADEPMPGGPTLDGDRQVNQLTIRLPIKWSDILTNAGQFVLLVTAVDDNQNKRVYLQKVSFLEVLMDEARFPSILRRQELLGTVIQQIKASIRGLSAEEVRGVLERLRVTAPAAGSGAGPGAAGAAPAGGAGKPRAGEAGVLVPRGARGATAVPTAMLPRGNPLGAAAERASLQRLGDSQYWYDPSSGAIFDSVTGRWRWVITNPYNGLPMMWDGVVQY